MQNEEFLKTQLNLCEAVRVNHPQDWATECAERHMELLRKYFHMVKAKHRGE